MPDAAAARPDRSARSVVLRIRQPVWARAYVVAFGVLWCALLTGMALHSSGATVALAAAMLLAGVAFCSAILRLGVDATSDVISVRNHLRTTRLARGEIEGFRAGPAPHQSVALSWCAHVLTRDGRVVPLAVTARPGWRGPSRRTRRDVDRLEHWLSGRTAGSGP